MSGTGDTTPLLYADSLKNEANTICDVIDCTEEEKKQTVFQKNSKGMTSTPLATPLGVSRKLQVSIAATLTHITVENTI